MDHSVADIANGQRAEEGEESCPVVEQSAGNVPPVASDGHVRNTPFEAEDHFDEEQGEEDEEDNEATSCCSLRAPSPVADSEVSAEESIDARSDQRPDAHRPTDVQHELPEFTHRLILIRSVHVVATTRRRER